MKAFIATLRAIQHKNKNEKREIGFEKASSLFSSLQESNFIWRGGDVAVLLAQERLPAVHLIAHLDSVAEAQCPEKEVLSILRKGTLGKGKN